MKLIGGTGVVLWACVTGALGCTDVEQRMQAKSCDQGRPTTLSLAKDIRGAKQAVAAGNDGFFLLVGGFRDAGVVHVDHEGALLEERPVPTSAFDPWLDDMALSSDGAVLLTGNPQRSTIDTVDTPRSWLGKYDADWQVLWELELGPSGVSQVLTLALPDGGAIVAGTTWNDKFGSNADDPTSDDVFWARVSQNGEVLWERRAQFAGGVSGFNRMLVLTPDNEVRVVVQTLGGLVVLGSDLFGENGVQQALDTRLALHLSAVAALPDGRLAIASSRSAGAILSIVDRDGNVEHEQSYAQEGDAEAQAVAYNAARNEILLGGSYRGDDEGTQRSWMIATDLQGNQTWELTRKPLDLMGANGDVTSLSAGSGPGIADLVPAPDGSFLAPAQSGFELMYFTVGAGSCDE